MAEGKGPDQEDHLPPLIDYLEDCMKFGESWCLDAAVLKIKLVIKKPNRSKVKNLAAIWLRQLLERTPVGEKADAAKRISREMKAEGEGKVSQVNARPVPCAKEQEVRAMQPFSDGVSNLRSSKMLHHGVQRIPFSETQTVRRGKAALSDQH
jgi:hypothetical protein